MAPRRFFVPALCLVLLLVHASRSATSTPKPKRIPVVADAFSFKAELIQPSSKMYDKNILRTQEQWYSFKSKLTRVDIKPLGEGVIGDLWDFAYGTNPLSVVHDFNSGHSYIMDKVIGNCTIAKIKPSLDDVMKPNHLVQMLNASEFFSLSGADYTYEGQEKVGDVLVDVWTAKRTDWPPQVKDQSDTTVTTWWKWKFLTDEWNELSNNEENTDASDIPYELQLEFETNLEGAIVYNYNYTINYYDFSNSAPLDWDFDIGPCWDNFAQRATLTLHFPGTHAQFIEDNIPKVKEMIHFSVSAFGLLVNSLRVTEPKLSFKKNDFDVDDVIATVEILGRPSIQGDVDASGVDMSVEYACLEILDVVKKGEFVVVIPNPKDPDQTKEEIKATNGWYFITGPNDHNHTIEGDPFDHYPCRVEKVNPDEQTKDLPKLPERYIAVMEIKDRVNNALYFAEEFYDYEHNHGRLDIWVNGTHVTVIYDYGNNQVLKVKNGKCKTLALNELGNLKNIFPFQPDGDEKHISPVKAFFFFNNGFKEHRLPNERKRDIMCEHYLSCLGYQGSIDVTMSVDWWFSSPKEVSMPLGEEYSRIPIEMHIKGQTVKSDEEPKPFDIVYTFIDFVPGEYKNFPDETNIFETPPGIFCKGKKSPPGLKPPKSPPAFSYKAQITQPKSDISEQNLLKTVETYYSYEKKLSRLDHRSIMGMPDPEGVPLTNDAMRDVHDFNTGIAYRQDLVTGDCKIEPIKKAFADSKEIEKDGFRFVQMMNATEFFHLEGNYQYVGKRRDAKGVLTDVWISQKKGWPPSQKDVPDYNTYITTWEWSFLDPEWVELSDNDANANATNIPYRLLLKMDIEYDGIQGTDVFGVYDYSIYDFTPLPPHWSKFDISLCYDKFKKAHFVIAFHGKHKDFIFAHVPYVKEMMIFSLTLWGNIETDVRVSNIEFDYEAANETIDSAERVVAVFTILDVAPLDGTVEDPIVQAPLANIVKDLKYAVTNSLFKVDVPNPHDPSETGLKLVALPESFKEVDRYDDYRKYQPKGTVFYNAGSGIGAGVGGAILGLAIGIGGVYVYARRKN